MCGDGKESFRPPKSAEELLRESQRVELERQKIIVDKLKTCWITDRMCQCGSPIYTDGKKEWCGNGCKNLDEGYKPFGFISDLIR